MDTAERNRIAESYVAAFAAEGSRALIANLETSAELHAWGEHLLPLTINDGEPIGTFVCSPRATYVGYTLEELTRFPDQRLARVLDALIRSVAALLGPSDLGRVVHINNWMLSTNLPVPLDPALALAQTRGLTARFPGHILAIRSLTRRHSAPLMAALEQAGWVMVPSRQVFLLDDVAAQSLPRRDSRRDEALWQEGRYSYSEPAELSRADAERIAALYAALYLGKYSPLNPAFTARFVALSHALGLIRYLVWRDHAGTIQAFGGMVAMGRHATMPMIGYNMAIDQAHGLYRLAFHAGTRFAAERGLHFNMSSGASAFKRNRGAEAEMEFAAFHLAHLPLRRRLPFALLRQVANRIGIPVLRKYQL